MIGAHPHVMQGMEIWKGRPIFWSLGNFIFDQDWSPETQRSLAITLLFGEQKIGVELYPVVVITSQPKLAEGDERTKLLARFAERSDLSNDLKEQAKQGVIVWKIK